MVQDANELATFLMEYHCFLKSQQANGGYSDLGIQQIF